MENELCATGGNVFVYQLQERGWCSACDGKTESLAITTSLQKAFDLAARFAEDKKYDLPLKWEGNNKAGKLVAKVFENGRVNGWAEIEIVFREKDTMFQYEVE